MNPFLHFPQVGAIKNFLTNYPEAQSPDILANRVNDFIAESFAELGIYQEEIQPTCRDLLKARLQLDDDRIENISQIMTRGLLACFDAHAQPAQ